MPMSTHRMTRRVCTATATGFAAGVCAVPFVASAQDATANADDATPTGAVQPRGYVSTRLRTVASPEARATIR